MSKPLLNISILSAANFFFRIICSSLVCLPTFRAYSSLLFITYNMFFFFWFPLHASPWTLILFYRSFPPEKSKSFFFLRYPDVVSILLYCLEFLFIVFPLNIVVSTIYPRVLSKQCKGFIHWSCQELEYLHESEIVVEIVDWDKPVLLLLAEMFR